MGIWRLGVGIAAILGGVLGVRAEKEVSTRIESAPVPAWVVPLEPKLSTEASVDTEGMTSWLLLSDEQVDVEKKVAYRHTAREYLQQEAVQDRSRLSVNFHPAYQKLVWHKLLIHRGGKTIDVWPKQRVRVLALEEGQEMFMYNGTVSAVIEVEDVRVGDVLEWSYSITGANPVFGGKFMDFTYCDGSVPIQNFFYRLRYSSNRQLFFKQQSSSLKETVVTKNGMVDRRWRAEDIPAVLWESEAPEWYDPYQWVQVSEYPDWASVVDWALPYYQIPTDLPKELAPIMANIRSEKNQHIQVIMALEYVQDKIRYLSESEGVHSHQPHEIEAVVRRGYGDCKDKSRLLCAMLRSLGMDASPGFVSTDSLQEVANYLPAPYDFNHVIVRLRHDGETFWLDPTVAGERGPLVKRRWPNYGVALVAELGQDSLTTVRPSEMKEFEVNAVERFFITGYGKVTRMKATTTYRNRAADSVRLNLRSRSQAQKEKDFLNYYAREWPGIEMAEPPTVTDDEERNVLTVNESYMIPDIWQDGETDTHRGAYFRELSISRLLSEPDHPYREWPLEPSRRAYMRSVKEVILPDNSTFDAERETVRSAFFNYEYEVLQHEKTLKIIHTYQSKKDVVMPEEMEGYLKDLKKARENLTYSISARRTAFEDAPPVPVKARPAPFPWQTVAFALLQIVLLVGFLTLAILLYFWRPTDALPPLSPGAPAGLGGWLVLVGLGVLVRPFVTGYSLVAVGKYYMPDVWRTMSDPASADHVPLWGQVIIFEMVSNTMLFALSLLLVVLFFSKRRTFPALLSVALILSPILILMDGLLIVSLVQKSHLVASSMTSFFKALIGTVIWLPYLWLSTRVAATFRR